jgi:hypothetical protein
MMKQFSFLIKQRRLLLLQVKTINNTKLRLLSTETTNIPHVNPNDNDDDNDDDDTTTKEQQLTSSTPDTVQTPFTLATLLRKSTLQQLENEYERKNITNARKKLIKLDYNITNFYGLDECRLHMQKPRDTRWILRRLPTRTTAEDVAKFLSPLGRIKNITMIYDPSPAAKRARLWTPQQLQQLQQQQQQQNNNTTKVDHITLTGTDFDRVEQIKSNCRMYRTNALEVALQLEEHQDELPKQKWIGPKHYNTKMMPASDLSISQLITTLLHLEHELFLSIRAVEAIFKYRIANAWEALDRTIQLSEDLRILVLEGRRRMSLLQLKKGQTDNNNNNNNNGDDDDNEQMDITLNDSPKLKLTSTVSHQEPLHLLSSNHIPLDGNNVSPDEDDTIIHSLTNQNNNKSFYESPLPEMLTPRQRMAMVNELKDINTENVINRVVKSLSDGQLSRIDSVERRLKWKEVVAELLPRVSAMVEWEDDYDGVTKESIRGMGKVVSLFGMCMLWDIETQRPVPVGVGENDTDIKLSQLSKAKNYLIRTISVLPITNATNISLLLAPITAIRRDDDNSFSNYIMELLSTYDDKFNEKYFISQESKGNYNGLVQLEFPSHFGAMDIVDRFEKSTDMNGVFMYWSVH